jgi:AcrR family transcriptional regulator
VIRISDKKFKNRQKLLSAALKEFSSTSYENASLNNILKTADLSKGSFYYHFKNKEDLYLALLKQSFEEKWSFIMGSDFLSEKSYSNLDIYDKFLVQAKLGMEFAKVHPEYHKLGKMFAQENGNAIHSSALSQLGASAVNPLDDMITQSIKNGEIDEAYSKEFIHKMLTHLFSSYDDIFDREDDYEKKLKEYIRFIKQGFTP